MKKILFVMLGFSYIILGAQQISQNNKDQYEQIVWFVDIDGNMYNYPPDIENDSIMKERLLYQKKLDSLNGKQFAKFFKK